MNYNALVVEDDIEIAHILSLTLAKIKVRADIVYSGNEAQQQLDKKSYDIVLLDLMLPGISGETLLPLIKKEHNSKIIVISAKTDIDEKVNLLSMGADDYITKPFDSKELTARVNVQLRNINNKSNNKELIWKDLKLDKDKRKVTLKNSLIPLTNTEFEILTILMQEPETAISKQKLYVAVQGVYIGDDNTISVHVSNIRKKINLYTDDIYLQTVWGIGFMLV
ncbi:response regulator transcription factor [Staphylococcus caprae]|uniref:Response regulator SaeR n=1 Tax=Staphylococcus caprae TaxID=29380 RepID=A0ABM7FSZ1_9STAP|nr:response regulator transcription factor [Staphylococcus caprae]EES41424.1 response regulator receiver domain protein [Staphylococcus caprae M23864:W1]MBN6826581.1 response regulator transcription factor [Staphylococcus caprae]MBX5317907.1 response regulator transcription factor [Staphylococcus caprae]MBX5323222.1 response regulator transcription factor [Staphylococcus caprae]MDI0014809.1 response regulator transcription factor [Staphylococcus caprae]